MQLGTSKDARRGNFTLTKMYIKEYGLITEKQLMVSSLNSKRYPYSKHGCVSAVWGHFCKWVTVCFRFICEPYWIDSRVTAAQFGWWKEDRSFSIIATCNSCAARSFMMLIDWTQIRERISLRALKRDSTVNLFVLFNVNLSPLWLCLSMEQGGDQNGRNGDHFLTKA